MNRLFYTCRNIQGRFTGGLLRNTRILESTKSYIHQLTNRTSDSGKNYIENKFGLHIERNVNLYSKFYSSVAVNMQNWKEVYDALDVSMLRDYAAFHIFGGLHFPQSNLTRFSKRCNTFPADRHQLKFRQVANHIINVLAIHKAHVIYDIPLHEFSYDSDELCTSLFNVEQNARRYFLYHIYDIEKYGMHRLDSLQYYYQRLKRLNVHSDKEFDFTFGYTVFANSNREKYIQYINEFSSKFDKRNVYVKNHISNEDTSINEDIYQQKISRSKYTLIIPSYDNHCFSMYRFIESIYNDCLPIIHKDCYVDDVQKSYDMDVSELITDNTFTEKKRIDLLKYFKSKVLQYTHSFQ